MRLALACLLAGAAAPVFAAFDETGFSARAVSMGSAFTAVYDDPAAAHYNPATLGQLRDVHVDTTYLRQFHIPAGQTNQDQMNAIGAVPINQELIRGGVAISWMYTHLPNYAIDRTYSFFYGSRGFWETENGTLEVGATLKFLSRDFALGGASTKPTVDSGLLYRFLGKYALGLAMINSNGPDFSGPFFLDRVPIALKAGFSESVRNFTMAFDFTKREPSGLHGGSSTIAAGIENWWPTARLGSLALRTGLNIGEQDKTWDLGLGWRIFGGQIDYSVQIPLQASPALSHGVSILFRFGQSNPEKEYEKLLKDELKYRKDLTHALEAGEVKQWQLEEELKGLREEIDSLRANLSDKKASESAARARLGELEERHRQAQESFRRIQERNKKLSEKTKLDFYKEDWAAYEKIKQGGAPAAILQDQVKRLLRQYKDSGLDLSEPNRELQRLQLAQ